MNFPHEPFSCPDVICFCMNSYTYISLCLHVPFPPRSSSPSSAHMIWSVRKQQADTTQLEIHRFTKHFLLLTSISTDGEGIRYRSNKLTAEDEDCTERHRHPLLALAWHQRTTRAAIWAPTCRRKFPPVKQKAQMMDDEDWDQIREGQM